jgi:copper resistance protein D
LFDPLIWVRAVQFIALTMVAGVVFFLVFVAEPAFQRANANVPMTSWLRLRLTRLAWFTLVVALISGAAWLVLIAEDVSDSNLTAVVSEGNVWKLLTQTEFGQGWLGRLALIGLLAIMLPWVSSSRGTALQQNGAAAIAATLIGGLAWASHAAGTGGIHFIADVLHLVAAAAWVGTLPPLILLLHAARKDGGAISLEVARVAVIRYSSLGITTVSVILVTGLINTWFLVGSVPALLGTDYGRLLTVKVALFLTMVSIAAVNRIWLRPRLFGERNIDALRHIERNSRIEAALGMVVLAVVGALGTMVPGLHQQPVWPLSIRINGDIFASPDLYITIIFGAAWIAFGIYMRRFRWPALAIGAAIFLLLGWHLPISEAYPTTYFASSTGFTAQSIARGERLFAANCSPCHGRDGRGDGPAGTALRVMPADLTADHVYDHSDGDQFWWITHGTPTGMPAFGDTIDAEGRWNLIDFIRANADATRLRVFGAGTTAGFPVPGFLVDCAGGSVSSIEDFRPQILHIVLPHPGSEGWLRATADRDRAAKLRTIVLAADPEVANALSLCGSQDPETIRTFAYYRGPHSGDGTEFLVDAEGNLRSMWQADDTATGRAAAALELRLHGLRSAPRVRRPSGMHAHSHAH